ncbi:MAG TPA: hypothetical protein VFG30_43690 [Polyangiales bacterium]|nr:hypothetical protein [Polyangiales bacterium]
MSRRSSQLQSGALAGLLLSFAAFAACQEEPTHTHIVLDVHVAKAIEDRVTSVVVHAEKRSSATTDDVRDAKASFKAGDAPRFVLQPAANQAQLQVRIVALQNREEIASAVLRSRYSAGRGLFLAVELGCEDAYDLGEQSASEEPAKPIDSCKYKKTPRAGAAGGPAAGSGGKPAMPKAGSSGEAPSGVTGEAGAAGSDANRGTGGAGSGAAGANVGGAGAGGGNPSAGAGGSADGSTVSNTGGQSGAGTSGAGAGGAAGGGGASGEPGTGCLTWQAVATISDAIETLSPPAFVAGTEHRDNPTENIPNFVCRATPAGTATQLVGKASKWGCYLPGPGATAYTVMDDLEILISSNTSPCLTWKTLSPTTAPTSPLIFGTGASAARVCRVSHAGVAEDRNTSGERVGQVRLESGQYVCRYEYYYYVENMTHVNEAGELTQVLDLAQ